MASENSLNHSMDSATKHYSSMFSLPSHKKALLAVAAICIIAINVSTLVLFPSLVSLALGGFAFRHNLHNQHNRK